MKKAILILLLITSVISYGQEKETKNEKNRTEIKFNVFSLAINSIDFELERTLNDYSSVGMSFKQAFFEGQTNSISAFYRYYLGKNYASGFFLEGFGMYHSKNDIFSRTFHFGTQDILELRSDFALGLGIGYKWVSKKGIIIQANLGAGRNLFNGKKSYGELYPGKAGINIGYRF